MITARFAGLEAMYYGGGQRGRCGKGPGALSARKAYNARKRVRACEDRAVRCWRSFSERRVGRRESARKLKNERYASVRCINSSILLKNNQIMENVK